MSNAPVAPTYRSGQASVAPLGGSSTDRARGAALQFLAQLSAEVSSGTVELPCFPDIVFRIRTALADPNTTSAQTVTIVGAEPRLAARLLQTANSVAFNLSGKRLTDLRTAITRLGQQLVQSVAMAFAVQHMKDEASLRTIAKPMSELWQDSIAVASICQVVARRTPINPDEAFLTGLMYGIGRLYIMVRAVGNPGGYGHDPAFLDLVAGWQASIGQAVLENWGFAEEIAEAVGNQSNRDGKRKFEPDLADVLVVSIALGAARQRPDRVVDMDGITAFQTLNLTVADCAEIMTLAEAQLDSLHAALGC